MEEQKKVEWFCHECEKRTTQDVTEEYNNMGELMSQESVCTVCNNIEHEEYPEEYGLGESDYPTSDDRGPW